MFGYIKTATPDLRVRENEFYRAVYCGLCHSSGKCTGCSSRLTLSYDITFMLLVRMVLFKEIPTFTKKRCPVHPLRKRNAMEHNEQSKYCARASAILAYYKLKDDLTDEKGMKKFRARLAMPMAGRMRKKALRDKSLLALDREIEKSLNELYELERNKISSVDTPANVFGSMLSVIMSYGLLHDSAEFKIAEQIGFYIGKWIYIIDALDDYCDDIINNRYNPIIYLYDGREITDKQREDMKNALTAVLMEAEKGFDLLEFYEVPDIINIIKNIIYIGMPNMADKVIFDKNGKEIVTHDKSI